MGRKPMWFLQVTRQIPARTQVFWALTWWSLPCVGLPLLARTKDGIGPHCLPSQHSLTELMGRRAEVYLAFKRKNKASVTLLCCAETVEMLFCSSSVSDEVQAEAQCLGFGRRSRLTWPPLCLSALCPSPGSLLPRVTLIVCLWLGTYTKGWIRRVTNSGLWKTKLLLRCRKQT